MAEPLLNGKFVKQKVSLKIAPTGCTFLTIFPLGNGPAICRSKSDVWDEMSAIVSYRNGSYFR